MKDRPLLFIKGKNRISHTKEIAAAIKEQLGYDIDKKKMTLDVPVKSPGTYNLAIKLHPKVTGELKVVVQEA